MARKVFGLYVPAYQKLGDDPKMVALALALKVPEPQVIGHLMYLWWWAQNHAVSGDLAEFPDEMVARAAHWHRRPVTAFVAALTETGWLDRDRTLHAWADYGGRVLTERDAHADRMRAAREAHVSSTEGARAPREQNRTEQNTGPGSLSTASKSPNGMEPVSIAEAAGEGLKARRGGAA